MKIMIMNFNVGAHPIDAQKCSVSQEVCKINIKNLMKK